MFWWRALLKRLRPFRTTLAAAVLVLLLLAVAKIHACACTGGKPEWRSLSTDPPSTQTAGDR
jgi:hypothetical protein